MSMKHSADCKKKKKIELSALKLHIEAHLIKPHSSHLIKKFTKGGVYKTEKFREMALPLQRLYCSNSFLIRSAPIASHQNNNRCSEVILLGLEWEIMTGLKTYFRK